MNPVHTTPSYLRSILTLHYHLHLSLPSGLYPSGSPTKTRITRSLCAFCGKNALKRSGSRVHGPAVRIIPFLYHVTERVSALNCLLHSTSNNKFRLWLIFLISEKKQNKITLMQSPRCLCACVSPTINFWMPEPVFMKFCIYIMAPEPISTTHFINPSHQSVSIRVFPRRC
jgi:hypothetical protein